MNDWKVNTRLKHCTPDSNVVKWFWKAVEFFDEERRARLLQFVTGSSRVPLQGFKALQGKKARGADGVASPNRGRGSVLGVHRWCTNMCLQTGFLCTLVPLCDSHVLIPFSPSSPLRPSQEPFLLGCSVTVVSAHVRDRMW